MTFTVAIHILITESDEVTIMPHVVADGFHRPDGARVSVVDRPCRVGLRESDGRSTSPFSCLTWMVCGIIHHRAFGAQLTTSAPTRPPSLVYACCTVLSSDLRIFVQYKYVHNCGIYSPPLDRDILPPKIRPVNTFFV